MLEENNMCNNLKQYKPERGLMIWGLKWWIWIVIAVIAMGAVAGIGSWLFGWFSVPGEITSPENVKKQWAFAYQYDESLHAAARQVCLTEKALNTAESDTEKTQRRSQLLAYETNYTRIEAEYNAKLRNAFEAGLVKPPDVPKTAPSLDEMKSRVCGQ
jgi:hypothetical protein